jgi:hypothetical protein
MYAPGKGRHELSDDFYDKLQNVYDKVNKKAWCLETWKCELKRRVNNWQQKEPESLLHIQQPENN